MRTLEATGKSIDEAIFNGLRELQISIDEVEIDIIQQETKGVFGIGAKPAIVRLIEREPEEVVIPDYIANKDKPRERRPRREARGPREERRERRAPEPREMQPREDAQALQDMKLLAQGIRLLQLDYLGGHGSRGSGRVSLRNFRIETFEADIDAAPLEEMFREVENYELLSF